MTDQQKLGLLVLEYKKIQAQFKIKDDECNKLTEKNKRLENKLEEYYKSNATGNLSNVSELKRQFEKETLIMKELSNTYKSSLDEKREENITLIEELSTVKNLLNSERNNYLDHINKINKIRESNNSTSNYEIENLKLQEEITTLKQKLSDTEERLTQSEEQEKLLKTMLKDLQKACNDDIDLIKSELKHKNTAYKNLLKDYQNTFQSLIQAQEQLEKSQFMMKKYENDNFSYIKNSRKIEHDNNELKTTINGLTLKQKSLDYELQTTRQKIRDIEKKQDEDKLSRQEFGVTYEYMKMQFAGKFIFIKEDESNFVFIIENKTNSRRFSFLDCELEKLSFSGNFLVKFIKEKKQEEYICDNVTKLIDAFNEFRRRAIEIHDFSSRTTEKEKIDKIIAIKTNKTQAINNLFDF